MTPVSWLKPPQVNVNDLGVRVICFFSLGGRRRGQRESQRLEERGTESEERRERRLRGRVGGLASASPEVPRSPMPALQSPPLQLRDTLPVEPKAHPSGALRSLPAS